MSKEKIEERKIIPIAAKISAGKSKLLNVLFNISFLESKAGIGTKFVNILRYNPDIQKPRFYHLKVEKENGKYVFYKDPNSNVKEGEKEIIEENKKVNNLFADSPIVKYEDIFYMTEINEVPFIKDKKFLLNHDFCDIPGLSEYQTTSEDKNKKEEKEEKLKKEEKDEESIEEQKYLEKLEIGRKRFGISIYKKRKPINIHSKKKKENEEINKEEINNEEKKEDAKEDDIFYSVDVVNEKTYLTEIFSILKENIDGAIIVLSVENFYFEDNFILITKLRKVVGKEIKNCLIVLNKIDLSDNPKVDIDKCKGLFMQKFPKCKTFNLNLNTFIPLSAIQLQNELLMETSFPHLIKYHFYNYLSKIKKEKKLSGTPICNSFIEHLREIIKKIKIMDNKEIEEKLKELNNSENISKIESDFKDIIKEIEEKYIDEELNLGITENDFNKRKKDDDDEDFDFDVNEDDGNEKSGNNNNDIDAFNACDIIKIIYIYQKEKKFIPPLSEETNNLLNYFKEKKVQKKKYIENKNELLSKSALNKEIINALKEFSKEIKKSKLEADKYNFLKDEILKVIEYLKTYDVIFIPFLGGSNAGKTTLINGIIGKDILPCDLNECTKRGILIRYSDTDDISLRKANFKSEQVLDKTNYYFKAGHEICRGEKDVKETLKGLNYDFNEKEEDSFYYIRTRIKLFDEMGLDKSVKEMVYLIDFPGYGTGNVFEKEIYNKVMSICNSFVFVVRNSVIKENTTKEVLDSIFTQAKEQKGKFVSQFIKSCLFILNNGPNQATTQNDLERAKGDVQTIIKGINSLNDINLCFFNAKYYLKYCDNFNYFSDIKELIDNEYKNYNDNKSQIIKNPESSQASIQKSFCEYFYNILLNKKDLIAVKMKKGQQISPEIESDVTEKLNEINEKENMKDLKKYEKNIKLILSFCKENINSMKTLKESNINEFKSIFYSQIKNFNDNMQEEIKEKMNNIITTLDMFFRKDFKERKKDIKEVNNFITSINLEKDKIAKLKKENEEKILMIETNIVNHIKGSLKNKKDIIENQLKSKNYNQILEEINSEMKSKLENLASQIKSFIDYNNEETSRIKSSAKRYIDFFSGRKNSLKNDFSFKKYITKDIGDENKEIDKDIYNEIETSCESLTNIFMKKGFKDWFCSLFSSKNYLQNIIDMMIDTFMSKIEYVFKVLQKSIKNYLNDLNHLIDQNVNFVTMKFNDEQIEIWKSLCLSYEKTREIVLKIQH